jgi:hypothetical protein
VDFIRAWLPADTLLPDSNGVIHHNGEIAYSYTVGPCIVTPTHKLTGENSLSIYPNPAKEILNIRSKRPFSKATTLELFDPFGRPVRKMDIPSGESIGSLSLVGLASGTYALRWLDEKDEIRVKMVVVQ